MRIKKILVLLGTLGAVVALRMSPLGNFLTIENLQMQKTFLKKFASDRFFLSAILFTFSYFFVTTFSIPGAAILTMAGGLLFGFFPALVCVNIGATSGAIGAFFVSRHILGSWVQMRYKEKLMRFNDELDEHGYNYLLVLRLIPIFPFFLINLAAGLTKIPFRTFLWTTALGIIPGSIIYVMAGQQLGQVARASDVLSLKFLMVLVLLALFALSPVLIRKIRRQA